MKKALGITWGLSSYGWRPPCATIPAGVKSVPLNQRRALTKFHF